MGLCDDRRSIGVVSAGDGAIRLAERTNFLILIT
jgi:hypothetical protein